MNEQRSEYERLIAPIEDRMIRSVWCIVKDPDDAEDALQDALLTIWKRWGYVRKHPNPHALILCICINSAHDMMRRKARRLKRLELNTIPEGIPDPSPGVIEGISRAEQGMRMLQAIACLSKNQARAILMHAVEEIPYVDIAAALGCREVTVRKHVARARAKLRALLSDLIRPTQSEEGVHA